MIPASALHGAGTAEELEPDSLAYPLDFSDENGADLAGGIDVGAPAGAAVQFLDRNDAKSPCSRDSLAQSNCFAGFLEADLYWPILDDHLVGSVLRQANLIRRQLTAFEIKGGDILSEMNADRGVSQQVGNHRRKEMLSGMLLHVIESPGPVDSSSRRACGQRFRQEVRYSLSFIHHVDNRNAAQLACIMGLAA